MVPKMIYHLLLIFLHTVHLCFGVSLDLAEDVVQEYKLRCALVVVDHPHNINNIKREVFRKLSVQAKVVLNSDIQHMRLLSRQSKFVYCCSKISYFGKQSQKIRMELNCQFFTIIL